MSNQQRNRLTQLTAVAVSALTCDIGTMLDTLVSNGVFTPNMVEDILSHRNRQTQAREIHMMISRRGPGAYEGYYKSLMECGINHLAEALEDILDPRYKREPMIVPPSYPQAVDTMPYIPPQPRPPIQDPRYYNPQYPNQPPHPNQQPYPNQPQNPYNPIQPPQQYYINQPPNQYNPIQQPQFNPNQPPYNQNQADFTDSPAAPLPDNWPQPEFNPNDLKVRPCKLNDNNVKQKIRDMSTNGVYELPHGYAIIVNNYDFSEAVTKSGEFLKDRLGTHADTQHMKTTLREIGFEVHVATDLKAAAIPLEIEKAATEPRAKKCFICVILSHGASGAIYGIDGELVSIKRLMDGIKDLLAGGPKVFIIQACQGTGKDHNLESMETNEKQPMQESGGDGNASLHLDVPTNSTENDQYLSSLRDLEEQFKDVSLGKNTTTDGAGMSMGPADMYIAMATIDGYVAWRNARGSWFIQAIVFALKNWAFCDNIDQLFTKVNNLVSKQEHQALGYHQVSIRHTTLSKDLYFLPGVKEEDITAMAAAR